MGEVKSYNKKEVMQYVSDQMAEGKSIVDIFNAPDMPSRMSFYNWCKKDPKLREELSFAREMQGDYFASRILAVSRGDHRKEDGVVKDDKIAVMRDRLEADNLKFICAKLFPKLYGDKVDLTTDGEKINEIKVSIVNPDAT